MEWGAIAAWLTVMAVLTAAGAPLAATVFDRLPGRGAAFAPLVSLVVIGLVSFWVGHHAYGWPALAAGLGVLAVLSLVALWQGVRPSVWAVVEGYAVFLAGFWFAVTIRVTNNTIGPAGGEQFLHFGLLNAVGRAETLPPEDMWWAGEAVHYYYGGHVLVDQLSRLAGTEPRLAYNLGLAVVFGLAAAAAYGLVGAVVDKYGYNRRAGGALGAAMLLLAGTVTTPARVLIAQLPESIATRYGAFAYEGIPTADPLPAVIAGYTSVDEWGWWFERRVVDGMLVETPLYSLVKADLHGHVTTIPFMVGLIAIALAYHATPAEARARRWGLLLVAFPAGAGLVGWMNTWSLPGAVGIAWLALAFAPAHPLSLFGERFDPTTAGSGLRRSFDEASRLVAATAGAATVGLLGAASIAPFLLFQLPSNDGIGLFPERSPFGQHLLLFGGFFALIAIFLAVALYRRYAVSERRRWLVGMAVATVVGGVGLAAAGYASLAVAGPLLLLTWWLARRRPTIGFIGLLIAGTLGLILSMELVHAEVWPPERERLNTTYKVSMQAMVFGLLAAAAIVTALVGDRLPPRGWRPTLGGTGVVVAAVVVVLLLGTFPVLTLAVEVGDFASAHPHVHYSIDALDGHDRWNAETMEAIEWLDERPGDPVLLEAPGEETYTFVNPASTFTGLPSVLGWAHQRGYRGVDAYDERQDAVDDIFKREGADPEEHLAAFDVDYIWVGDAERDRYMLHLRDFGEYEWATVAFENENVTIYRIDHESL